MNSSKNITNLSLVKNAKKQNSKVSALSPREIVSELDRYVIGQKDAKKAVAVALRNRWRRQALSEEMRDEVLPKNILEKDINEVIKFDLNQTLTPPSRVVIGGCNKTTKINIIKEISKYFEKEDILVLPIITLEILKDIKELLEKLNYDIFVSLIQTYKSLSISEGTRFEPNNPVFIIKAKKK